MAMKEKEFECELIVINVSSKDDTVTLDLRFAQPHFREPTERRLEDIAEPLPKTPMEKMGRDMGKGYMNAVTKQMQEAQQQMAQIFPSTRPPPDIIRITISKQEYVELGRPTIDDELTLTLRMKNI